MDFWLLLLIHGFIWWNDRNVGWQNAPTAVTPLTYFMEQRCYHCCANQFDCWCLCCYGFTDANNCNATASATVASYAQLTVSYSNTVSNCTNVVMTFTGLLPNTAGYQYGWTFEMVIPANVRIAPIPLLQQAHILWYSQWPISMAVPIPNQNKSWSLTLLHSLLTTVSTTTCVGVVMV